MDTGSAASGRPVGDRPQASSSIRARAKSSASCPQGFRFVNTEPDLIVPAQFDRGRLILAGFGFQGIARLKPGVTIAQANADIARLITRLDGLLVEWTRHQPAVYETWRITPAIRPLKQEVIGNVGDVLWVVMGTIGIVMLIACANVANLLLVRAEARQQELAVRAALGAGWGRIVRELLLESVVARTDRRRARIGARLRRACVSWWPLVRRICRASTKSPSIARALAFTLVLSLLSGLLFGLIPALKYAGPRISLGSPQRRAHSRARAANGIAPATSWWSPRWRWPGAAGQRGADDPYVPGVADRRSGIHRCGASPDRADLHSGLADCGTGASRPERRTTLWTSCRRFRA